jgi:exonuclease SbcD
MGYDVYRPSPRVVGLADFHIGNYRFPIRRQMVALLRNYIVPAINAIEPDIILFAGDAFRTRTPSAQDYADLGEAISVLGAELIMIPGNHDIISSRDATTLDVYDEYPNVTVVNEPTIIQRKEFQVCCIPWLPAKALSSFGLEPQDNAGLIRALVSLLKGQLTPNKFSILLAHCTALGTEYHDGASTVLGNDVLWTSDMFEGFDLCILGHIHKPQQVKGTDNAWYVGSPCPVSFNEADQQKTLFVYDGAPIFNEIDAPSFVQIDTLPLAEGTDLGNSFVQIKRKHDEPDPIVPFCLWHEIVPLPPERDIRQRLDGDEAMSMKPEDALEMWLLPETDDIEVTQKVLDLAKRLLEGE